EGLFARGALELLWLSVRGEPLAAVYDIVWKDRVFHYQSGRRIDVPRNLRPGIVLIAHAVRRAIALARRGIDFLGGDPRYKRALSTGCRAAVRLRAVRDPQSARERARALAQGGIDAARAVVRGARAEGEAAGPPAVLHGDLNMLRCFAGTGVPTVV